ncbi:MAG: hypothetical protein R3D44_06525 [Hyphomicrobiaceae bacterium]
MKGADEGDTMGRGDLDAPDAPPLPSGWRWLLVAVPLVAILAIGSWLVVSWTGRHARLAEQTRQAGERAGPGPKAAASSESEQPSHRHSRNETGPRPPSALPPRVEGNPSGQSASRRQQLDVASVVARIATANVEDGRRLFRICSVCHFADPGAGARIGPNLWGVVGASKAARLDFEYSLALRARGGIWSEEELAAYLNNPRIAVPGTKMAFAGVADPDKLAALLAYMRTLSDGPAPRPIGK